MARKRIFLDSETLAHLYNEEHLGIDAIAARLGTSHGTVWRALDGFGIPRRPLSDAITRHKRVDFSGDNCEKAYLIGLRLGDLWVRKNKPGSGSKTIVVSCHTTVQAQIDLVESLFEPYGHVDIKCNPGGTLRILCYLNLTFDFLLPKLDEIPSWIRPKPIWFLSFLAGYVDAEGSFCVDRHGNAVFQLKSYDVNILKQIAECMNSQAGIALNAPRVAQLRGSPTGKGYYLRKDAWTLSIARRETLLAFCMTINPYLRHQKRRSDLSQVLRHLMPR